ncbi:YjjG family noncanonical pyrimidine nucleotidase [Confluentibacter flavum]|uniref:Noncanonical pyrimidine nucleotidase, YjjG family n=1 Tax=Confluentibacter flavum TaxID=1909700 RepID=A0A2N3HFG8_9FLAO|nr:YjjG family noncanonical pyrimidine nucleotidase [Confluentibacter flavum]PKQ43508.1 noncanonical pyrimidine nucleotidase, YjjG family [Confluentibacter flavum]
MKIKGITDVFFDLDHTLWDFDKNSALTFDKIFKINQIEINLNDFLVHYKAINLQYWKLYRDEKIDKDVLRFGRLNDTFSVLNHTVEKEIIQKLSTDYITYLTDNNYLYDDAITILEYLHKNYNLHILSNGFEEVQSKKLTKSNILHYFKTITNGEDIGVKKPNPQIFHYAIEKANTNIANSIMIGDGYEADILGALNIGMDVIFFDEFQKPVESNIKKINNLIEIKKYL